MAFKHGINPDPLEVLSSWNDSVHYCRWPGVNCSSHRHIDRVTSLSLRSYRLVGSLSPPIGNLTFFRSIRLQNNSFHGEIPSELGGLFRLRELMLRNNSFEGTFPINLVSTMILRIRYSMGPGPVWLALRNGLIPLKPCGHFPNERV